MDAVTGSLGGLGSLGGVDEGLPLGGGALVPEVGSGIPSGPFGGASGSSAGLPF